LQQTIQNKDVSRFYRATQATHASAVLAVVILCLSIRPSVRLSVTRVLCDKTKQCIADILIPQERAITVVFWHQLWLVGDAPCVWNFRSKWLTSFEKRRVWQIFAPLI